MKGIVHQSAALVLCVGVCFAAAAVGAMFTNPNVPGWYANLNKPWWTPPGWVFGPVWSLLYLLAVLMLGAVSMHVKVRDPLKKTLPSMSVLVLCLVVAFG